MRWHRPFVRSVCVGTAALKPDDNRFHQLSSELNESSIPESNESSNNDVEESFMPESNKSPNEDVVKSSKPELNGSDVLESSSGKVVKSKFVEYRSV